MHKPRKVGKMLAADLPHTAMHAYMKPCILTSTCWVLQWTLTRSCISMTDLRSPQLRLWAVPYPRCCRQANINEVAVVVVVLTHITVSTRVTSVKRCRM